MFRLFKPRPKTAFNPNYFPIEMDMHAHILPGIDDGAKDIHQSLELVKGMMQLGIQQVIATPHIIGDLYRNTAQTIQTALSSLQTALVETGYDFKIQAAAEYMLDDYFLHLLKQDQPLLTLRKNYILTEFSWMHMPENVNELCFRILTGGYIPILAHPERYTYYHHDYQHYHRLYDLGFKLQVNLLSFTGYYGPQVAKAARYLIEANLIDYAGTDIHHLQHLDALQQDKNRIVFQELLSRKTFNQFDGL